MELIRKLGTRLSKSGRLESWGEFLCPVCLQLVERLLSCGKIQKSCGCIPKNKKHGGKGSKLYITWSNMKQRCNNPNHNSYQDYGGRGIEVCDEWLNFIPFRDWSLSNGYLENLQIDRINTKGNYEPSNCRYVTSQINNQNQLTTKLTKSLVAEIKALGKTNKYTHQELADKYNISRQNITNILNGKRWGNVK